MSEDKTAARRVLVDAPKDSTRVLTLNERFAMIKRPVVQTEFAVKLDDKKILKKMERELEQQEKRSLQVQQKRQLTVAKIAKPPGAHAATAERNLKKIKRDAARPNRNGASTSPGPNSRGAGGGANNSSNRGGGNAGSVRGRGRGRGGAVASSAGRGGRGGAAGRGGQQNGNATRGAKAGTRGAAKAGRGATKAVGGAAKTAKPKKDPAAAKVRSSHAWRLGGGDSDCVVRCLNAMRCVIVPVALISIIGTLYRWHGSGLLCREEDGALFDS